MSVQLDRIGWEDGTLVSPAKVSIGGTVYDVSPEVYSGSTPLSAENLKQMEDNTEIAINALDASIPKLAILKKEARITANTETNVPITYDSIDGTIVSSVLIGSIGSAANAAIEFVKPHTLTGQRNKVDEVRIKTTADQTVVLSLLVFYIES